MAKDPRAEAHNEAVRRQRIRDEEEAIKRRSQKSKAAMRDQSEYHRLEREKANSKGGTGCSLVFLVIAGAPMAMVAQKWFA